MTIAEVNKVLKEMKELIKFNDSKTNITLKPRCNDPFICSNDTVRIETTINDTAISMERTIDKNTKGENNND